MTMKEISLEEYVKGLTQGVTAKRIGVSQGALSQMLSSERKIFVQLMGDEVVDVYEIKPVGPKRKNNH